MHFFIIDKLEKKIIGVNNAIELLLDFIKSIFNKFSFMNIKNINYVLDRLYITKKKKKKKKLKNKQNKKLKNEIKK